MFFRPYLLCHTIQSMEGMKISGGEMEEIEVREGGNGRTGRSIKEHQATRQWMVNCVILHEVLASHSELCSDIRNVHTP